MPLAAPNAPAAPAPVHPSPVAMAREVFAVDDERHLYGPYYCRGVQDERARLAAWLRAQGATVNGMAPHVRHPDLLAEELEGKVHP